MASGTRIFFFLSVHLEPFVNVVAIHPEHGTRGTWGAVQIEELKQVILYYELMVYYKLNFY